MNSRPAKKSPYRSLLRAEQAAATRELVLDAATRLFVERGYAATSIDAIAEAAGVGRSTVFAASGGAQTVRDQRPGRDRRRACAHRRRGGRTGLSDLRSDPRRRRLRPRSRRPLERNRSATPDWRRGFRDV